MSEPTELHFASKTAQPPASSWREGQARTLVVAGGKAGVGATTLAVQIAATLAHEGHRVIVIDADLYRADLTAACDFTGGLHIGHVLTGQKTIHEAIRLGTAGLQLLAGMTAAETRDKLNDRAVGRLIRQMAALGPHADWLVVDAGNEPSHLAAQLWATADRLLVVTTPDAVAVMDSYALIKTLSSQQPHPSPVALAVNQARSEAIAKDVHRRIDQSCQRFLGLSIGLTGWLPHDAAVSQHRSTEPLGRGPLADAIHRLAHEIAPAQSSRKAA